MEIDINHNGNECVTVKEVVDENERISDVLVNENEVLMEVNCSAEHVQLNGPNLNTSVILGELKNVILVDFEKLYCNLKDVCDSEKAHYENMIREKGDEIAKLKNVILVQSCAIVSKNACDNDKDQKKSVQSSTETTSNAINKERKYKRRIHYPLVMNKNADEKACIPQVVFYNNYSLIGTDFSST